MVLAHVTTGDGHVAAHNAERDAINQASLFLNVKSAPFNALGNGGSGDDTAAVQAAIDAASAYASGSPVTVYFPPGTYMLAGKLTWKVNVRLVGAGENVTILKSSSGAASNILIEGTGVGNMDMEHLTIDMNNRTNSIAATINPGGNNTTAGSKYRVAHVTVKNATNNCFRVAGLASNVMFDHCTWDTCTVGMHFYPVTGQTIRNITVKDCYWTNVGTNNLLFVGQNQGEFENVLIEGNTQRNYQNVGANGPIPMELWGIDNLRIIGNTCVGGGVGTRGIGFARCRNTTMLGNTITGMITYGSEIGNNDWFIIQGNVYKDCAQWIEATGPCTNGLIDDNNFSGTGLAAINAGRAGIRFDANVASRIRITNNLFYNWAYLGIVIKLGISMATDCDVTGNTFVVDDPNSSILCINIRRATRAYVSRNIFRINKNLTPAGGTFDDDISDVIQVTPDSLSTDVVVSDNDFQYTGTFGTVTNHAAIGHGSTGVAAFPPGLVIRRNRVKDGVRGLRLSAISAPDAIVEDNDTRGCLTADSFHAALVYRRTVRIFEATAVPSSGTWVQGDKAVNRTPAVGSPKGWVCTVSGTPGTWVSEGNL